MNKGTWITEGVYKPHLSGGIYASSYERGTHTYGDPMVMNYLAPAKLRVGDYCSIADGVEILLGGEHHINFVSTFPFNPVLRVQGLTGYPHTNGDVTIGNDVFIGRNAMILSGVTIGDGAVIGAGAVVRDDVEPYQIVVGNPAGGRGYRFEAHLRDVLLEIAWWNWPEEKVLKYAHLLQDNNINKFIEECRCGKNS